MFLEVSLSSFVLDDFICSSGRQMVEEPPSSFNAEISATLQLFVGLFQEKHAN